MPRAVIAPSFVFFCSIFIIELCALQKPVVVLAVRPGELKSSESTVLQNKTKLQPVSLAIAGVNNNSSFKYSTADLLSVNRKQIKVNKCSTASSELPDMFIVPDYVQSPLSPEKSLELAQIYEGGLLFKFKLVTEKDRGCRSSNASASASASASTASQMVVYNLSRESENVEQLEFYFTHDGYFKTKTDRDFFFGPEHYCIASVKENGDSISVHVYPPQKPKDVIIRKCCPLGSVVVLDVNDLSRKPACMEVNPDQEWTPFWYRKNVISSSGKDYIFTKVNSTDVCNNKTSKLFEPYYWRASLGCSKDKKMHGYNFLISNRNVSGPYLADIRVVETGEVFSRPTGNDKWDRPKLYRQYYIQEFCIDGFVDEANQDENWKRNETNQVIMFCKIDTSGQESNIRMYGALYFGLLIISLSFHLLTVVVYGLVWEKQNIHGWTIAAFSFTMLCNTFFHVIYHGFSLFQNNFQNSTIIKPGSQFCISIGILLHFFYVASFAWMTVLNFDLWATISSMTSLTNRSKGRKRFLAYISFGFGVPTLVVSISLILENRFDVFSDTVIRPQYGHILCGVDKSAVLAHQISVSCVLLAFSFLFAGLTVKSLYDFKRGTQQVQHSSSSKAKGFSGQIKLIGKLFILMGFSWTFELVSWLVAGDEITWYWAILDSYNILQGIGLFWIFVFKKEIHDQMCDKFEFFADLFKWADHKYRRMTLTSRLFTSTTTGGGHIGNNKKETESPKTSIADVSSIYELECPFEFLIIIHNYLF